MASSVAVESGLGGSAGPGPGAAGPAGLAQRPAGPGRLPSQIGPGPRLWPTRGGPAAAPESSLHALGDSGPGSVEAPSRSASRRPGPAAALKKESQSKILNGIPSCY